MAFDVEQDPEKAFEIINEIKYRAQLKRISQSPLAEFAEAFNRGLTITEYRQL